MKLFGRKTVAMACVLGVVGFAIVQARAQQVLPADQAYQGTSPPSASIAAVADTKKPADAPKSAANVDELQAQLDQTKKQRDEALADAAKQTKEAAAANATVTCMTGELALRSTCLLDVATNHAGTAAAVKAKEQVTIAIARRSPMMPSFPTQATLDTPMPALVPAPACNSVGPLGAPTKPRVANQAPRPRVAARQPSNACNGNALFR